MKKHWTKWQYPLLLLAVCAWGCNKDNATNPAPPPYDPAEKVVITGFTPEQGAAYQQLLIFGRNFGNDKSLISVMIGGRKAVVISTTGTCVYCFVPQKAYSGTIEVTVGREGDPEQGIPDTRQTVSPHKPFTYVSEMLVGTLCGYKNQYDDQGWKPGPFATCAGFGRDAIMAFDPQNRNHLYICYDGYNWIQVIDLEKKEVRNVYNVSQGGFPDNRIRSIDFTAELPRHGKPAGQYMILTLDYDGLGMNSPNVYAIERNADGTFDNNSRTKVIANYRQCNGAAVHPVNGEIYFNSYENGQLFRMDPNDWLDDPAGWNPSQETNPRIEELFTIADPDWEYKIFIHPSGTYAYLVVVGRDYIMRTDYNPETKRFVTPYIVAGTPNRNGYIDGVGVDARFFRLYQGVFVKNPEYTKGDQYDFYVADGWNHCIRTLTPDGMVSTFAGRGQSSVAADGNYWGADDGGLRTTARFDNVTGLTYDPESETFYVLCTNGRTLRTISMDRGDRQ